MCASTFDLAREILFARTDGDGRGRTALGPRMKQLWLGEVLTTLPTTPDRPLPWSTIAFFPQRRSRRRCCCDKVLYPIILAGEGGAAKIGQHKVRNGKGEGKRYSIVLTNTQRPHSLTFVNGNAVHPWRVFLCSMYRCG